MNEKEGGMSVPLLVLKKGEPEDEKRAKGRTRQIHRDLSLWMFDRARGASFSLRERCFVAEASSFDRRKRKKERERERGVSFVSFLTRREKAKRAEHPWASSQLLGSSSPVLISESEG